MAAQAGLRAREGTRGLLALRSSSGLGVPTSCKRAGEEAAATGARLPVVFREVVLYDNAGSPRPGVSSVVWRRPRRGRQRVMRPWPRCG